MCLEMDVSGIFVKLKITEYTDALEGCWEWCKCDFSVRSGDWLNYHFEDSEVLCAHEIKKLEKLLTKLLNDEIDEIGAFPCIEPDFCFSP